MEITKKQITLLKSVKVSKCDKDILKTALYNGNRHIHRTNFALTISLPVDTSEGDTGKGFILPELKAGSYSLVDKRIISGNKSFPIAYDIEEFPELPTKEFDGVCSLPFSELLQAYNALRNFYATSPNRYAINGILLELFEDESFNLVATNGKFLGYSNKKCLNKTPDKTFLILPDAFEVLRKLKSYKVDTVTISEVDNKINFSIPDVLELSSILIDGHFPNWREVIPRNNGINWLVNTETLKETISTLEKEDNIILNFDGNNLHIQNGKLMEHSFSANIQVEGFQPIAICFNVEFLLKVICNEVTKFTLKDSDSACLIDDTKVLMPVSMS